MGRKGMLCEEGSRTEGQWGSGLRALRHALRRRPKAMPTPEKGSCREEGAREEGWRAVGVWLPHESPPEKC